MEKHRPTARSYYFTFRYRYAGENRIQRYYICKDCGRKITISRSQQIITEIVDWIAYCLIMFSVFPIERKLLQVMGITKINLAAFLIMAVYCVAVYIIYQTVKFPFLSFEPCSNDERQFRI